VKLSENASPTTSPTVSTPEEAGLVNASVQLGWAVLTSGWTALLVGGLIAALFTVGGHVDPIGSSFKELLATHDFATARTLRGLGLDDAPTGWLTLLLYVVAGLNAIGLFLRYGLAMGGPQRPLDGRTGPWVSQVSATVDASVPEVVKALPEAFSRTRRRRGSDLVTSQRGLWEGAWVLVIAAAITILASMAVDRGSAFDGRVSLVPSSRQAAVTEFRSDRGDWIKRPALGLVCLPADPSDPTRTRSCRLPGRSDGGVSEATLAAGEAAQLGNLTLRQTEELALPALINEGSGPSLLLRDGGRDGAAQRLQVTANGATYRVNSGGAAVELSSFFGPDGPFVVARMPGKPPVLMTPALAKASEPVPGTKLHLAGIPWWRVEFRLSTDPGRYLRYTAIGLLLVALLVMLLLADVRVIIEPNPDGSGSVIAVRSANRRGLPAEHLEQVVKALKDGVLAPGGGK